MNHTAINPAWQKKLNQLYAADRRYSDLVDKHQVALDALDPESDRYHDLAAKQEDIQAFRWEDMVDHYIHNAEIPGRELKAYSKAYQAHHGYEPYLV